MPLPAAIRSAHPYFMHDEIHAQPEAIARAIDEGRNANPEIAARVRNAKRVAIIGNGTSFHAAQVGSAVLQTALPETDVRATQAFEYVTYQRHERHDDVVFAVSHAGETAMSIAALEQLQGTPVYTVAVTGFPESTAGKAANAVLPTGYEAELSWAHTVSYTAAISVIAGLAATAGQSDAARDMSEALMVLPDQAQRATELEAVVLERVAEVNAMRNIWFVGAATNQFTATEAGLKMIETCCTTAIGLELEQLLHGYFPAIDQRDCIWLIAPGADPAARAADIVKAAGIIGIPCFAQTDEKSPGLVPFPRELVLPRTVAGLSAILHVIPVQLLSYWIAVERGTNPDLIGRSKDAYLAAADSYE